MTVYFLYECQNLNLFMQIKFRILASRIQREGQNCSFSYCEQYALLCIFTIPRMYLSSVAFHWICAKYSKVKSYKYDNQN